MEMCEIPEHPFFFACQYHPEYQSRPARPSPPFLGLLLAAAGNFQERLEADGGVLRVGAGFYREPKDGPEASKLDAKCCARTLKCNGSGV